MEASQAVDDSWRLKKRGKKKRGRTLGSKMSLERERSVVGREPVGLAAHRGHTAAERVQAEEMNNDC